MVGVLHGPSCLEDIIGHCVRQKLLGRRADTCDIRMVPVRGGQLKLSPSPMACHQARKASKANGSQVIPKKTATAPVCSNHSSDPTKSK